MSKLSKQAEAIVELLATAHGRGNALRAAQIAKWLDTSARRVREIISNEFAGISGALPSPLISIPPTGYWLSTDATELRERAAWLAANRDRYDIAIDAHVAMCKRHGLAGVLSDRTDKRDVRRKEAA